MWDPLKFNNDDTRKMPLDVGSVVFIVNYEQISYPVLVFPFVDFEQGNTKWSSKNLFILIVYRLLTEVIKVRLIKS